MICNSLKLLAPRDGLEPPTKWLIPPLAGLYQLNSFQIPKKNIGSPGRTRTADKVVNSHPLYQLSYRGTASIYLTLTCIQSQ